jgi:hypothetical protein
MAGAEFGIDRQGREIGTKNHEATTEGISVTKGG